jgi:ribokinase
MTSEDVLRQGQEAADLAASRLRVVVLGGLNMDLVVRVAELPRAGETVAGEDLLRAAGGKGGNQAVALARLGGAVSMIGRVGRDAFGRELRHGLMEAGVATRWVGYSGRPTGAALILVDDRGENSIAVASGANADLAAAAIPRRVFESAEVVVASLEVPLASIAEAFRLAHSAGARTVLNTAPARQVGEELLGLSDVLICNEIELASLLAGGSDGLDVAAAARALRSRDEQVVVVTLGQRGVVAISGAEVFEQSAFRVSTVDTTGAGDAFVGGFVMGRWWSAGLADALRWGCAAGALATTKSGAQPSMPGLSELRQLLQT